MITETEAYAGAIDKASHAYNNRRTARTETMYQPGGVAYVYLCYGVHHLFNVVTNVQDIPHAVLIRAIEPLEGIDVMLQRRGLHQPTHKLTAGPGSMSAALGINYKAHNGLPLNGAVLYIEDRHIVIGENQIVASPRIGVNYAGADALLPYRFTIAGNPWVSKVPTQKPG